MSKEKRKRKVRMKKNALKRRLSIKRQLDKVMKKLKVISINETITY